MGDGGCGWRRDDWEAEDGKGKTEEREKELCGGQKIK